MTSDADDLEPPHDERPADDDDRDPQEADGDAVELADPVRRRVAGYAAEAMRALQPNQVPASLRFAMRWRSGRPLPRGFAEHIGAVLAKDAEFRARVGAQLAESDVLAGALDADSDAADRDPSEVAALLYLVRPPDWRARLDGLKAALSPPPADELARAQREVEELRARLERAQQRRERDVAQAREQQAATRARLSETVDRLREQLAAAGRERDAAVSANEALQREAAVLEREVRRVRAALDQATSQAEQSRVADKDARLAASARAGVLLQVLQGAVEGLSAELALPPGVAAPADLVPAATPAAPVMIKRLRTAAELTDALTVPRCHLIVDGYNVSKGIWQQAPLLQQRESLISALSRLRARTGAEITVVFDGADVGAVPTMATTAVRVRFSDAGELADRVIVRLVAAEPQGRPIVVVSSDTSLSSGARSAGARTADSATLAELLRAGR